jgi:long-chain fatty acid transport protein
MASTAAAALLATIGSASAGGFYIREQSAMFQGMSFAGNAAGGALSSMFWNSAATASEDGLNTESTYSAILGNSKVTVTGVEYPNLAVQNALGPGFDAASPDSGDIGPPALVPASYGSYQLTENIYLGMAVNAPFGLKTDPTNTMYKGAVIARKTELATYNFNPTVAVRIAPGITIGAGVQVQTADGIFRFATGVPLGETTKVEANGWGFGGTAGIMIEASPTTTIGVGYRSQIDQELDGHISTEGTNLLSQKTEATMHLPDIVTVSVSQVVSPSLRVNGTFEWTNWSRFKSLTVYAAEDGVNALQLTGSAAGSEIASLPLDWRDGYYLAGGIEYDIYPNLTGRFGLAYEWSPVDSPEKRTPGFPDNNRVWLSGGFSWDFTKSTTIDFGYTHIFVEDGAFERESLGTGVVVSGEVETQVDIVSVGLKTKW